MESQPDIVFSFQGAFGPPTWGHYTAMKIYARQVLKDYPDNNILMLFMPTALGSSKPHLEPTQESRIYLLTEFCKYLTQEEEFVGKLISFIPSDIEYKLCKDERDTATHRTVEKLHSIYQKSILLLGMGQDNMLQMPYWKLVETYVALGVKKIYVASRQLTPVEKLTTRKFYIINDKDKDKDEDKAIVYFDIKNPNWGLKILDQTRKAFMVDGETYEELSRNLKAFMNDETHVYNCYLNLPEFVMVGEGQIPGTSSSMMRYYICKYIKGNADTRYKDREKIRKLIWGTTSKDNLVDFIIEDYRIKGLFEGDCPPDNDYDKSFSAIFSQIGGKKTYKKRGKYNKLKRSKGIYKKITKQYKHSKIK